MKPLEYTQICTQNFDIEKKVYYNNEATYAVNPMYFLTRVKEPSGMREDAFRQSEKAVRNGVLSEYISNDENTQRTIQEDISMKSSQMTLMLDGSQCNSVLETTEERRERIWRCSQEYQKLKKKSQINDYFKGVLCGDKKRRKKK